MTPFDFVGISLMIVSIVFLYYYVKRQYPLKALKVFAKFKKQKIQFKGTEDLKNLPFETKLNILTGILDTSYQVRISVMPDNSIVLHSVDVYGFPETDEKPDNKSMTG